MLQQIGGIEVPFLIFLICISAVGSILCIICFIQFFYWLKAGQRLASFEYFTAVPKGLTIVLVLCFSFVFIIDIVDKNLFTSKDYVTIWFIAVYSIYMILGTFVKNQIKEKGIFNESLFIRWDEISDFEIVEKRANGTFIDTYVLLKLKNKKQFRENVKIRNLDSNSINIIKMKTALMEDDLK